jgi:hypothetical protein
MKKQSGLADSPFFKPANMGAEKPSPVDEAESFTNEQKDDFFEPDK